MKLTDSRGASTDEDVSERSGRPGATTRTQHLPVQRKASAPAATPSLLPSPSAERADPFDFSTGVTEVPHRAQMESAFGRDLGFVQAQTGAADTRSHLGAEAAACGNQVSFADASPSPWLVAHELTHVVQQAQSGAAAVDRKPSMGSDTGAAEAEADHVADRVVAGLPAGPISAQPEAVQRFAPIHHAEATAGGLAGSYTDQEIGQIYASNWERDFSQGHPAIANAAIAWAAVKNADRERQPIATHAAVFKAAVETVVNQQLITTGTTTSLGDTTTWEHMDHPDDPLDNAIADARWQQLGSGLSGYLLDSRAYIKDQMVAAIDVYRLIESTGMVGNAIDNWKGGMKPQGYVAPEPSRYGDKVYSTLPAEYDDARVESRYPIVESTAAMARDANATAEVDRDDDDRQRWAAVAQHLGRAMHAFEDFWAHSNWLELAYEAYRREAFGGDPIAEGELATGTFTMPDKAHALGHKLLALSTALQGDFQLLLRVYGRDKASDKLETGRATYLRSTSYGSNDWSDERMAFRPLENDANGWKNEMLDVATVANNVEELALTDRYDIEDFLCNEHFLEALKQKGHALIEQGHHDSTDTAHGRMAKDQHEEGKGHGGAKLLATAANEMVFGPLRAIMDERDSRKALALTKAQLELVDRMLQVPSPSHPLWAHVVDAYAADQGPHDDHDH